MLTRTRMMIIGAAVLMSSGAADQPLLPRIADSGISAHERGERRTFRATPLRTRSGQDRVSIFGDAPSVSIYPGTGTVSGSSVSVTIDVKLNELAETLVTLSGQDVSSQIVWTETFSSDGGVMLIHRKGTATLPLQSGDNVLTVSATEGNNWRTTTESVTYHVPVYGTPPTVTITPSGGLVRTADQSVTIDWCDDEWLSMDGRRIALNGRDVTSTFSLQQTFVSGCGSAYRATGTVRLPSAGTHTLEAAISDSWGQLTARTASYTLDLAPPTVSVSPTSDTVSVQNLTVTLDWSDNVGLNIGSRQITLNGVVVTNGFTYTGSGTSAQLVGTVTLAQGTNLLQATMADAAGNHTTVSKRFYSTAYQISVRGSATTATPQQGTTNTVEFTIENTGTADAYIGMDLACSGSAVMNCAYTQSAPTLAPGANIKVPVTYTAGPAGSVGTITLKAHWGRTGELAGEASVAVKPHNQDGALSVSVTPDGEAVQAPAGTSQTRAFSITSTGAATLNLACAASGSGVTSCSLPGGSSISLSANNPQTVNVSYGVGAVGSTGRLTLTATQSGGTATDPGTIDVSAVSSSSGTKELAPVISLAPHSRDPQNTDRDLCVNLAIGAAAASECGDLRIVHGLPATRTLNKIRAPALLYNSNHAAPRILVAADVTLPADGMQPTRVVAQLLEPNGAPAVTREWSGTHWTSGATRRILLDLDASAKPTGLYTYTLKVENWYGTLQKNLVATVSLQVPVVNRGQIGNHFGAGWWVAGYEQIVFPSAWGGSVILWVGGDGSTRKYVKDATRDVWRAPALDRPDSITRSPTDYRYTRYLRGGGTVIYSSSGHHQETRDRVGNRTVFAHSGTQLTHIHLPTGTSVSRAYGFVYANGFLDYVWAPGLSSSTHRRADVSIDASGRLTSILDPDNYRVSFGYSGSERRIGTRTDKRGTVTTFGYDAAGKVSSSLVFADGQRIELKVASAESEGLASALVLKAPTNVFTQVDGPRPDTDVRDVTKFWIGRFGAVERVVDAVGAETKLLRGDPRFPALVTEIQYPKLPDGRQKITRASYDARGLPLSTTQINPYGSGDATTRFEYDPVWPEFVSKITYPELNFVRIGYDARGNRSWQEDGRGSTSRVSYTYFANGLVSTVTAPAPAGSGAASVTTRIDYDRSVWNLSAVQSPLQSADGVRTTYHADAIGRDTLVVEPVAGSEVRKQFTKYDVMDRALATRSVGLNWNGLVGTNPIMDTVAVVNEYDPEGNTRFVTRQTKPDPNRQGALRTEWIYDTVGRVKQINRPGRASEIFEYNAAGLFTRHTTGRICNPATGSRCVITMVYDPVGQMTERIIPQLTYPTQPIVYIGDTQLKAFPLHPLDPDYATQRLVIPTDVQTFGYDAMGSLRFAKSRDAWVRRGYHTDGALRADTLNIRTYTGTDFSRHQYVQSYAYDRNGRRVAATHPSQLAPVPGGKVSYGYDPAMGALSWMQDAMGNSFSWTHDGQGNVETYAPQVGFTERFTYDLDGRLARRSGTTSKYGGANYLPSSTYRDDRFTYDLLGRARTRSGSMGETGNYEYAGNGALAYSDEVTSELSYLYRHIDALGNPVTEKEWVPGTPGTDSEHGYMAQRNYGYKYGRVVSQDNRPDGSATYDFDFAAEYDQAGNRDVVASGRVVNPDPNDPQAIYERSRSYYGADERLRVVDRRKCLTKKVWSSSLGRYTTVCVAWDQRLDPEPSVFEEYRYDALGRRILVRSRPDTQCSNCPAFIQRTVWDGDQILHEIRYPGADGADLEKDAGWGPSGAYGRITYTHGPGIDAPLSLAREYFSLAGSAEGKFAAILHGNWRGLADIATFPDGTVRRCDSGGTNCTDLRSAFDWPATNFNLFYRRRVVSQTTPPNWIGSLVSNKRDASGQLYMRNRYYDPTTGQFTQEDPIGLAGGLNLYGYANGDPVNFSDPFGLCEDDDPICRMFVDWMRSLSKKEGDVFDKTARIYDGLKNARVYLVESDHIMLTHVGGDPYKRRLQAATGHVARYSNGKTKAVYIAGLSGDRPPGNIVKTAVHEAVHVEGSDSHKPDSEIRAREREACASLPSYQQCQ